MQPINNYAIITDSTSDLTPLLMQRFNIDGMLLGRISTHLEEDAEVKMDLSDAEIDDFYSSLKANKDKYKTSPMSADKMAEYFETFLAKGQDIITISITGALSATYNIMLTAKDIALVKYPNRKIFVIDSEKYSIGVALLAIKAAELRKEGLTVEQNAEKLNVIRRTIHHMGPIDDLFWVASKGRISHSKAFFGTVFGIKPLGDFDANGTVTVLAKVSGHDKALKATTEYVKRTIKSADKQIIIVAHSGRRKLAETLAKQIEEKIKPKEVIISNIYPSIGINIGPGLVAAFFEGTTITDLEFEKKTMNEIIASKLK